MLTVPEPVSRSVSSLSDNPNWARIVDWMRESRDALRVANDEAEPEMVARNQGGLRELNEFLGAVDNVSEDLNRARDGREVPEPI